MVLENEKPEEFAIFEFKNESLKSQAEEPRSELKNLNVKGH
jgi:hypothetical protein